MTLSRLRSSCAFALASAILCACTTSTADLEKHVRPEDDAFARAYIDTLVQGRSDLVAARVLPGTPISGLVDSLASVRRSLPSIPKRPMLVGLEQRVFEHVTATVLVYELHGQAEYSLVRVGVAEELGVRFISTLMAERTKAPSAQTNALTFKGKGPAHFVVLVVGIGTLLFSFFAAFYVIDAKVPWRWLWSLLALIGANQIVFDWTTGAVDLSWIVVRVPVLGVARLSPTGPWFFILSLPVGAFIAFERARQYRHSKTRQAAAGTDSTMAA